jgi:group I intron endonuclease
MYGIIYKAAGPTGKVYIGQTTKLLNRRKADHKFRALKGDRRTPFQIALLDEGFKNFTWEQIDTAENKAELDQKEKYWVDHYDSMNPAKGYNNTDGGIHYSPSVETRRKIGEANKNPSATTRQKISEARKGKIPWMKGKRHTVESRQKQCEAHKGKTPWNKGKTGVYDKETRRKNSEAHKGIYAGEKNPNAKITEAIARQIKLDLQNGMRNCDIARKHGVGRGIINHIKFGHIWKHIQTP